MAWGNSSGPSARTIGLTNDTSNAVGRHNRDMTPTDVTLEHVTASPTPHRLGVHLVEGGAVVGVFAGHASGVELCLFDVDDNETRVALHGPTAGVWHAFVPGIDEGQLYGF